MKISPKASQVCRRANYQDGIFKRTSLDLLDADHVERQELVQHGDGVDHHLREEVFLLQKKCPIVVKKSQSKQSGTGSVPRGLEVF